MLITTALCSRAPACGSGLADEFFGVALQRVQICGWPWWIAMYKHLLSTILPQHMKDHRFLPPLNFGASKLPAGLKAVVMLLQHLYCSLGRRRHDCETTGSEFAHLWNRRDTQSPIGQFIKTMCTIMHAIYTTRTEHHARAVHQTPGSEEAALSDDWTKVSVQLVVVILSLGAQVERRVQYSL